MILDDVKMVVPKESKCSCVSGPDVHIAHPLREERCKFYGRYLLGCKLLYEECDESFGRATPQKLSFVVVEPQIL